MLQTIYQNIGLLMLVTGIAHCAIGLMGFSDVVTEVLRQRVLNTVQRNEYKKMTFLWYEAAGLALIAIGYLVQWCLHTNGVGLPFAFRGLLLAMALFVAALFPRAGALIFLAESLVLLLGGLNGEY